MAIIIPEPFKGPRPGKFFAEGWDWFDGVDEPVYFGWEEPGFACMDARFIVYASIEKDFVVHVNMEKDPEEIEEKLYHLIGEKE